MTTKIRKQIYINPDQETLLKRLAREIGVTEAEIIRQAISSHVHLFRSPQRDITAWEKERIFITQLIQQGPVPGRRTWRREDLYER